MFFFLGLFVIGGLAFWASQDQALAQRFEARWQARRQGQDASLAAPFYGKRTKKAKQAKSSSQRVGQVRSRFERSSCELCSSPPRVQYKNKQKNFTLEFCYGHSVKKGPALVASGFKKTISEA